MSATDNNSEDDLGIPPALLPPAKKSPKATPPIFGSAKRYQLSKLMPRHREIMRLELQGVPKIEIVRRTGMSMNAISYITNSDIYIEEFRKLQDKADRIAIERAIDIRDELHKLAEWGVQELRKTAETTDAERLKTEIIWDALDRDGFGAPQKHEVLHDYVSTLEKAFALRKQIQEQNAREEALAKSGDVAIDVTPAPSAQEDKVE